MLSSIARSQSPPAEPQSSILDAHETAIREVLNDGPEMPAPAVLERLRPLGTKGGVTILRRRLRRLRPHGHREAFLTLHFAPAETMQVDWRVRVAHGVAQRAFAAVPCHSRYLYIEFTVSQACAQLLRGTTAVDIVDKTRPSRSRTRPRRPCSIPGSRRRARRAFALWACNVRKGNEKGRVERTIGLVRRPTGPVAGSAICSSSMRRPSLGHCRQRPRVLASLAYGTQQWLSDDVYQPLGGSRGGA